MIEEECPIAKTMKLLQGKWKGVIIYLLFQQKVCHFSELQHLIPNCSKRLLALQLKELEKQGVVEKRVYPTVPVRTEYLLTDFGKSLIPILQSMNDWGSDYPTLNGDNDERKELNA